MKYSALKEHIFDAVNGNGKFAAAYFVYGSDDYLVGEAVKMFENAVDKEFASFNYTVSSDVGETIETLYTFPVFDARRVCCLEMGDDATEEDVAALKAYLASPADESVLVTRCSEMRARGLSKGFETVVCDALTQDEIAHEVRALLEKPFPTPISDGAIEELVARTQSSMARIVSEAQKLKAYSPNGIEKKDVENMVAPDLEYQTYMLSEAVSAKDGDKALNMLKTILDSGVPPRVVLMSIYDRYRKMLHVSLCRDLPNDELARLLGMRKPGAVYYLRKGAEMYSQSRLKSTVDRLHAMQMESMSGRSDLNLLEEAVLELLNL